MGTDAARRLWSRSTQLGLRYTTYVGDGSSSTYQAVQQLNPYDVTVQKEECVNHDTGTSTCSNVALCACVFERPFFLSPTA
ncbi:hypothetical protein Pcinc_019557 [Petrolisthes cinctipes]|uniref:Mutator-like transposase domain-containing protein n=1 Tax=Petrolisthes cinctipes TaxID=88211 RepID=A0AAE1FJX0_PETCI|nr:hypothetical protein Pcinc_019557 [Petrolisthes cinctipes]